MLIFVAVEIQPPFFYHVLTKVPKKKPQKYCYRLYLNLKFKNSSEHGFKLAMCSPEKSHHILNLTSPLLPIIFLIYKHSVFITKHFFTRKIPVTYINFYVVHNFLHYIFFFLPTHAFLQDFFFTYL